VHSDFARVSSVAVNSAVLCDAGRRPSVFVRAVRPVPYVLAFDSNDPAAVSPSISLLYNFNATEVNQSHCSG